MSHSMSITPQEEDAKSQPIPIRVGEGGAGNLQKASKATMDQEVGILEGEFEALLIPF